LKKIIIKRRENHGRIEKKIERERERERARKQSELLHNKRKQTTVLYVSNVYAARNKVLVAVNFFFSTKCHSTIVSAGSLKIIRKEQGGGEEKITKIKKNYFSLHHHWHASHRRNDVNQCNLRAKH